MGNINDFSGGEEVCDIAQLSPVELLLLHSRITEELRNRGITRTSNNPTGDLAEYLFCKAFGWTRATNSNPHIDAVANDGVRYQVKGRRITRHNKSRQLGAIREYGGHHFDFLAAVVFTEEYSVFRAALIPYTIVGKKAKFIERTNSHKFILHDSIWNEPSVQDVTGSLRAITF